MDQTKRIGLVTALFLTLAAPACGSSVTENNGGGGGTSGCPASGLPADGSACSVEGEQCGAIEECGPLAECISGRWVVTGDTSDPCACGLCPPACPDTQPTDGSACSEEGASCSYTDPSCSDAGADATCSGGLWSVTQHGPACIPYCPSSLPAAGASCDACCLANDCSYLDSSGCPSLAACQNGVWVISPSNCNPTSQCALLGMNDCNASSDCRWMALAGCPSTLQNFPQGCYPAADCASDADCADGSKCTAVEVDPCPGGDCSACKAQAQICVP